MVNKPFPGPSESSQHPRWGIELNEFHSFLFLDPSILSKFPSPPMEVGDFVVVHGLTSEVGEFRGGELIAKSNIGR